MNPVAVFTTALGLSTDAFAAALARGAAGDRQHLLAALRVGAVFGGTEGSLCLLGWLLAAQFASYITALDHWIALVVLTVLGGRMIGSGLFAADDDDDGAEEGAEEGATDGNEGGASAPAPAAAPTSAPLIAIALTAIGTSIDAAAVGVAFAFLEVNILAAVGAIALTSGLMSTAGYFAGPYAGARLGAYAEAVGGTILIAIGFSIFVSHMAAP